MKKVAVDLNADVGESYGPYKMGSDEDLFPLITSANIACGFHAGDPGTMRRTLDLAVKFNVAVGAHPGYPDRLHFGRIALPYPYQEVADFILYQVGALQAMAESAGIKLQHIKLHGALYHLAAEDKRLAETLLDAVVRLHDALIVIGPDNSVLQAEAEERGLDFAVEGFADRGYTDEGKLVPRGKPNSIVHEPAAAAEQAIQMVRERKITTVTGKAIEAKISTICIHGDTPGAARIAKAVREKLENAKVAIEPLRQIFS
jgi:UPF0271 protein